MSDKFYKRRQFLQTAGLFSAGLMASLASPRLTRASDEPVEAVVIGSGFGGAVAALRLGQAGIKTLVLERGRRWAITPDQNTFATYRKPDGRAAWLSSKTPLYDEVPIDIYTGIVQRTDENGISVVRGAGVGGGSLVYNGITYQPPRETFYRSFPRGINYDEMDKVYYPLVRSILKPSPLPQDILATSYYKSTRVFLEQANAAGLVNGLLKMATDWDIVRQEINGNKIASAIIGEMWYGINSGAKKSLDTNYLPLAIKTGNVEILPLHVVKEISENAEGGYRISCNQIDESGETIATKFITCRYLFLAAGSMGTSELLVKAKAKGTLPKLNDYVGQDWASNGDTLGIRSGLPPTNPGQGGPATSFIEHLNNPLGPVILVQYPTWNAPEGTLSALGMTIPSDKGSFSYDAATDSVKLTWPADSQGNKELLKRVNYTYKILDKRNARFNHQPTTELMVGSHRRKSRPTSTNSNAITVHPLGGAVMEKVCDTYGRVIGYQGLYVVDGALIPGSTGCTPPSLTIAALAERCMNRIIADIS
jgi:cholesterol oxidase